jgi:hypothetical protein
MQKLSYIFVFLCVLLESLVIAEQTYAENSGGSVVISEVMWMGTDISTADEWVELALPSGVSESVQLGGWRLVLYKNGEESLIIQFDVGTVMHPGEYLVVSNFDADASRLFNEPDFVTTAISLPNTKLLLRLHDAGGEVIDEVDDGVGAPFAGNNTDPKASMERIDLDDSGSLQSNWRTAEVSLGFDDGEPIFGTPGFPNGSIDPPQSSSSSSSSFSSFASSSSFSSFQSSSSFSSSSARSSEGSEEGISYIPFIKFTEILANPVGSDDSEWIEIANVGTDVASIAGCILREGISGKTWEIPKNYPLLESGEHRLLRKSETGLTLRNGGGELRIESGTLLIDLLAYPEAKEGVSYGRTEDYSENRLFCVPTEGRSNTLILLHPEIEIQSGETEGEKKVTINLEATLDDASLSLIECYWDYGDGFTSDRCNPPSHTFENPGNYWIRLRVYTVCGNLIHRTLEVRVEEDDKEEEKEAEEEKEKEEASSSAKAMADKEEKCEVRTQSGIIISEIFPSPAFGEEEWIELFNKTNTEASLCGWALDDVQKGGSKKWLIEEDISIQAHGFITLAKDQTGLSLNNTGDDVVLFSPSEDIASHVTYPKMKYGHSYAWSPENFAWCTVPYSTPEAINNCPDVSSQESLTVGLKKNTAPSKSASSPLKIRYKNIVEAAEILGDEEEIPEIFSALRSQFIDMDMPKEIVKTGKIEEKKGWGRGIFGFVLGCISSGGISIILSRKSKFWPESG